MCLTDFVRKLGVYAEPMTDAQKAAAPKTGGGSSDRPPEDLLAKHVPTGMGSDCAAKVIYLCCRR